MIYLDYNATTPLCEPARIAMLPFLSEHFGNPSSVHAAGREARAAIDNARDKLAWLLHARPHELIFTSSGTEANNLAVIGLASAHAQHGRHLICSTVEHHAVLHAFEHLQKTGFDVTWLRVDREGRVNPDELAGAIRDDTTLVSIMTANNETGVIQPMREVSAVCRERGVLLHSDMVQSFGKVVMSSEVEESPRSATDSARECLDSARHDRIGDFVDAASFAAHKFYGPKGAGLLFLRSGIRIEPILFGGGHENQRRAGTENVAAIAGMAAAAEWTLAGREAEQEREAGLREKLWRGIEPCGALANTMTPHRLANTLNVSFCSAGKLDGLKPSSSDPARVRPLELDGLKPSSSSSAIDSETMLIALDLEGVCASSGSACMVGSIVQSHVLLAMGLPPARARAAVRFSLGKQTTTQEIEAAIAIVRRITARFAERQPRYAVG